jgi:hypothetical protein
VSLRVTSVDGIRRVKAPSGSFDLDLVDGVSRNFGGICHQQVFVEQTAKFFGTSSPQQVGGQATKGTRWMPWRQEAMKDVVSCEKLRGVASRRRSEDVRMGKPNRGHSLLLLG